MTLPWKRVGGIAWLSVLLQIAPGITEASEENKPKRARVLEERIQMELPEGWEKTDEGIFFTSEGAAVALAVTEFVSDTARQLATERLGTLERALTAPEHSQTDMSPGAIVTRPIDVVVGGRGCTKIVYDARTVYDSPSGLLRNEEYFCKDQDTLVELYIAAPIEQMHALGPKHAQAIETILRSLRIRQGDETPSSAP